MVTRFLLLLLGGLAAEPAFPRSPQGKTVDLPTVSGSMSTQPRVGLSSRAVSPGVRLILYPAEVEVARDTGERHFDPGGYYFPEPRVLIAGYEITTLALHTLNYYYDGKLHYDDPQVVTDPQLLIFRPTSGAGQELRALCPEQRISSDTLHLKCQSDYLGSISIDGNFLDKRGDFGNLFSNEPHPQFVLSAVITVEQKGRVVYRQRHSFRYFEGD